MIGANMLAPAFTHIDELALPYPAIALLFVAFVAALVGFGVAIVRLAISDEKRVSRFREEWMDKLKEDLSAFMSLLEAERSHETNMALRAKYDLVMLRLCSPRHSALRVSVDSAYRAHASENLALLQRQIVTLRTQFRQLR